MDSINRLYKKVKDYFGGINSILMILYVTFIFSFNCFINNNSWHNVLKSLLKVLIIAIIIVPPILRMFRHLSYNIIYTRKTNTKKRLVALFYVVPLIVMLTFYGICYPGGVSPDSLVQYEQYVYNDYSDWHPIFQTLFTFTLPLTIFNGWYGSVMLVQCILFAVTIGYSINTIYKHFGAPTSIIVMLFILLNPKLNTIGMYPWKDVSFAIFALLLVTFGLEIVLSKGEWLKDNKNFAFLIIILIMTTLFRHNAILFTFPFAFAVCFYLSKKRAICMLAIFLVGFYAIKGGLYRIYDLSTPPRRVVETTGLPMSVIGYVASRDYDSLNSDSKNFINAIVAYPEWKTNYYLGFNSIKWLEDSSVMPIEVYGYDGVFRVLLDCFNSSPFKATKGLFRMLGGIFSFDEIYKQETNVNVRPNTYGIKKFEVNYPKYYLKQYNNYCFRKLDYLFFYIGTMQLLVVAAVLATKKLNDINDIKKVLFCIPLFAYNIGTSLLLTGISDIHRFFYYSFLIAPIIVLTICGERKENT